jgi:hypothetical protein
MNKTERIYELEYKLFILSMKDRYTAADYEQERNWKAELAELKK